MFTRTVSAIIIAMLLTSTLALAFNIQPANAYSEGTTYEEFGPRADELLIKLYPNEAAEWDALARGEIDITDWPLSKSYYDLFNSDAINPATGLPYNETIDTFSFPQFDFYILDINNNNNPNLGNPPDPAYPNPVYPNPTSVKEMRQAIAYLVDRNQLTTIIGKDFYIPLYTVVPPWMGYYTHPEIKPGGLLEHLTYPYSRAAATTKLDLGGFPVNPSTGWRFWDRNGDGVEEPDEYLGLKFVIRNDSEYRLAFGNFLADELNAVKVRVNRTYCTLGQARALVMSNKDFHLYTGGWTGLGPDPDHLGVWTWDYYFHPGWCENYAGINNPDFNTYSSSVFSAGTPDEAKTNAWLAQEVFASEALSVPLWSEVGRKAMSKVYTGGNKWTPVYPDDGENAYRGGYWDGIVNMPGKGIDNSATFLNMHPSGFEKGGTIRWGFKTTNIESPNPIYAEWLWEWNILDLIYDRLLVRTPHNQPELIPWLAQDFEVGTYNNPAYGECSKIRFTLRPDATWTDGNPITAADVYFTFVELPKMLGIRGFPPPWWYPSLQNILDFKIFDPYNFEVLLNTKSYFLIRWLTQFWSSHTIILPKHVWKPIVETGDPRTSVPDPDMIGNGPWRFVEYVQGSHVLLVANKPGSVVKTNLPGSTPVTSPKGFFKYGPIFAEARVDGTTNAKIDCYAQPHTIDYIIRNSYLDGPVIVDVSVTYPNGSTYSAVGVAIAAEGSWQHSWTGEITGKKATSILVNIVSPSAFAGTYDWSRVCWSTIREDITGSHHVDLSLSAPDIMVDVKDLALASKAFGTHPGDPSWNKWGKYSDINGDYRVNAKDVAPIASKFGWRVYP